ncbi:MAG: pitrilysin family protein [Cyclobacteriaceae bacterium]|nr:pitrilysin family protein [Cyclobacteriaceae bacterium]
MPDRKKQPHFQKSLHFQIKNPDAFLKQGRAPLFILHGGEQDVIRLEFIFRAGKWFETTPGLAHFSSVLLTKGTSALSGNEISERLEELGYQIESGVSPDYAYLTAYGLRENFKPALEIIKSCLLNPVFPEHELRQHQEIYLQQLKVNQEKTSYLASKLFRQQLFGKEHPYASEATEPEVHALTHEEIANYYKQHYHDFFVFLAGKTDDSVRESAIELTEQLPWNSHALPEHKPAPSDEKRVHQPKAKAVQASVRIGKPIISRNHPDFPKVVLTNYILGGYFGSRLMNVIREEKGLTYGIYSTIQSQKKATVFSIGADVNQHQAEEVIEETFNQLKDLRTKPVQQKELELAKNHFIGSLQNEMSNIFAHMERFKTVYLFNLPSDYYSRLILEINAATSDDILLVSEKYFHEEDMTVAMVG